MIDRNGGLRLAAIVGSSSLWQRFQQFFLRYDKPGFSIDISRMRFPDDFFEKMQPKIDKAFAAMRELEAGAIANPDEHRMVGHYWLRNPVLAPTKEVRADIEETNSRIKGFAAEVHGGKIGAENRQRFGHFSNWDRRLRSGPQLSQNALGTERDPMQIHSTIPTRTA